MLGPDASDAVAVRPAIATPGTPGLWFTPGNLLATPPVRPTRLRSAFLNRLLAELRNLLGAASITESAGDESQVLESIRRLIGQGTLISLPASGSYTLPATVSRFRFRLVGGGGAGGGGLAGSNGTGGSSGGGGGAGGYAEGWATVAPGATLTVVVGAGGQNATSAAGTDGGTTAIAGIASCTGGSGGAVGSTGSFGGAGGTGSVMAGIDGVWTLGGFGTDGNAASASGVGGCGGASAFGGGGRGGTVYGVTGQAWGSGGGGGYLNNNLGGNGAPGIILLEFWA